jgi:dihydropteroate synthase
MGILNVTPDSFADGGLTADLRSAVESGLRMEADGADIIDIGGESTRPGAEPVPVAEELRRVVPVIEALAARVGVPLSVDTSKSAVAREALAAGAAIVNDISGLRYDAGVGQAAARSGAALVLMHMRGRSSDMYRFALYDDLLGEIGAELAEAVSAAEKAGVERERLILDPGIGFAKRPEHSYAVLARLERLAALDRPLLVGPSRKSFLGAALGDVRPPARDWGTAAAVAAAIVGGAHIVRVHAVGEMAQVARVTDEICRHAVHDQEHAGE